MSRYAVWIIAAALTAVAFVIGAKVGAARYRELGRVAKDVWNDPGVQKVRVAAYRKIEKAADRAAKEM